MRNVLLVIVGLVDLAANFPYIRDALKGKTKPNIASWSTWTLINGIAAVAALAAGGALNTVISGASYFVGSLSILIIGIFKGTRKYTKLDIFCQAIAIVGVGLWQLSNNPNIALVFAIVADICAVIPTLRHAYFYPGEETWATFAIASAGALVLLCLSSTISFASLAIPIDFFLANTLIASVIIYRGKSLLPQSNAS
jgi:hypothetical protein